jgi:hypothetical protein
VPSLKITRLKEGDHNFHFARLEVLCTMAYPMDNAVGAELRGRYLYELCAKGIESLEVSKCIEILEERLQVNELELLVLRRLSEVGAKQISQEAAEQIHRGLVAGSVLLFALRCGQYRPEHRSVSEAIFVESQRLIGSPNSSSIREASVSRCWNEFKSVAHLYAAFQLLEEQGIYFNEDTLPPDAADFEESTLGTDVGTPLPNVTPFSLFLSLAEVISEAAHRQLPPIGRSSTVDSHDGRRLIDRRQIVRVTGGPERLPVEFQMRGLTEAELDYLSKYRRYPLTKRAQHP